MTGLDVLIHLSVIGLVGGVYLTVPYELLVYRPVEGSVLLAYLSMLGHADAGHLFGNLVGFVVPSGTALVLLAAVGDKRRYYASLFGIAVIIPPLAALLWELQVQWGTTTPGPGGSGLSLLTSALLALVVTAMVPTVQRVRERGSDISSPTRWSAAVTMVGTLALVGTIIGLRTGRPALTTLLFGIVTLAFLTWVVRTLRGALEQRAMPARRAVGRSVIGFAVVVGGSVDLFVLAPESALRAHLVGLVLGLIITAVVVCWGLERRP